MIESHHLIPSLRVTPAEMFGPQSDLAPEALATTEVVTSPGVEFGVVAQLMIVAVAVVYIIFIMRYAGFVGHFLFSSVGIKLSSQKHSHINPSERINLEIVMLTIGTITLSAVGVRLLGDKAASLLNSAESIWLTGAIIAGALVALVGGSLLALLLSALVCDTKALCQGLVQIKLMHLAIFCALATPLSIVYILGGNHFAEVGLWSIALVAFISLILYVKESFLFFMTQKVSILHWILYLCALEIFPTSLLVAPLLRGGVGIG